jgi:thiosulfate reductase cytochrome b subunit
MQPAQAPGKIMSDKTIPTLKTGPLIYRQSIWTRVTHWTWAIALFFLLLSGLQIFNAHPALYIGQQSGFEFDNAVLKMYAEAQNGAARGYTELFGNKIDTTGVFGMSGPAARPQFRGFPAALTIPSYQDLATGRVVHFFFGWVFVATILIWFLASFISGHIRRDVIPTPADLSRLPKDIADHARLRFHHGRSYNVLQKLAYSGVFFVLFPLIVLTGLTMSPGMDAAWPWLVELFGGRQTARTIHFSVMVLLVLFFVVHIIMVFAAGPINELRSMITGWYRASPGTPTDVARGEK